MERSDGKIIGITSARERSGYKAKSSLEGITALAGMSAGVKAAEAISIKPLA